jgi:hypothetical protein
MTGFLQIEDVIDELMIRLPDIGPSVLTKGPVEINCSNFKIK